MSFESALEQRSIRERIVFPDIEPILDMLRKYVHESGGAKMGAEKMGAEKALDEEAVKDIFYEFIEQRIEGAGVYKSERHDAAFPWGVTNTGELAKKLYAHYAGQEKIAELAPNTEKRRVEVMFTSLQFIQSGSQFAFMEEAMHQMIKDLPAALADIEAGKEPNVNEIYTLGSPTNELGAVSIGFVDKLKDGKAFDEFGSLYAEFIESKILGEKGKLGAENISGAENVSLLLYGQSMGASFATGTAKHLIEDGRVTQTPKQEGDADAAAIDLPFMQVRLDMPVGSSDLSLIRKHAQIVAGFFLDALYTAKTDPYLRKVMMKDKEFLSSVQGIFTENGMPPQMSEEQVKLKKEGILKTITSLLSETAVPENIKVTKVIGTYDPLMYSLRSHLDMIEKGDIGKGSLGESLVPRPKDDTETDNLGSDDTTGPENERKFAINMHHAMPYFRENELKRMLRAVEAVSAIRTK